MNPPPLVGAMLDAARQSAQDLAARVASVRPLVYSGSGPERFTFTLDGKPHEGVLKGRNRSLCFGFGEAQDKAIAVRVLLDGDAD